MPFIALLILTLFLPLQSDAANPERRAQSATEVIAVDPINIELGQAKDGPKYSTLKKMPVGEVLKIIEIYTGRNDTWKNQSPLISRVQRLIPFQQKKSPQQEVENASYLLARHSSTALQDYAIALHQSRNPEVREMIANVQGDKMLVFKNYVLLPPYDVRSIALFFQSLEHGDTGLETKKFSEYARAFDNLAHRVEKAYERAAQFNMPLILEFESSALTAKSPLTRLFFNTLVSNPEHIMKAEITPNRGRILAIHPFYAKEIVRNLKLFAAQFELNVNTLKTRIFTDSEAKVRLMNLLRTGEGMSGIFYTEERMQELAIKAKEAVSKPGFCARIFGSN